MRLPKFLHRRGTSTSRSLTWPGGSLVRKGEYGHFVGSDGVRIAGTVTEVWPNYRVIVSGFNRRSEAVSGAMIESQRQVVALGVRR